MSRFVMPRDVFFGENALEDLKILEGHKKAIIVTGGSSMKKFGFLDKLESILAGIGLEVKYINGIEPDPSVETVLKGAKTMEDFGPDVIIGIGGGSTIDAAKAMWIFYEHPNLSFDDVKEAFSIPSLRKKAILVAIPSTSGTATEVTSAAVVTNYEEKVKYPLVSPELVPDIAILDTSIPQTLLPHLVAHTGMDALTHAIEAYVATGKSRISQGLARQAIEGIYNNLVMSYNGSKEARAEMHMAQSLAGMAFSNAGLGIAHSIAHQTGVPFELSHGCCNAVLLPYIIQFNAKTNMESYGEIARFLGLAGATNQQLVSSLVDSIFNLNKKLDIHTNFKDFGVAEDVLLDQLDYMAKNALKDGNTPTNPREASLEDIKNILKAAYYGKPVAF